MDHQEKCKKYKRQIEDLKLDNIQLLESLGALTVRYKALKDKLKAAEASKSQWGL